MKLSRLLMLSTLLFVTVGCTVGSNQSSSTGSQSNERAKLSMILPTGTPLFGMSTYMAQSDNLSSEVVSGADSLSAVFADGSKDVIVAPVNLGANMYSKNQKYVLFETFVWGNLYVASKEPIASFSDLQDKKIAIFGVNQTPDIIMQTLAKENNITYEKELTDSVESSTALFKQGVVDYFVGAEPSLSKLKATDDKLYTLDLQEEWKKVTGKTSYPQAGIFVKSSEVNRLKDELARMKDCVNALEEDVDYTVECALKQESLSKLGAETLKASLPNCHFGIEDNQKEAIEFYFTKLIDLGLGQTMGGVLPSEEFYLSL